MPDVSKNLIILRDKEMIGTDALNQALEQSFNANSWGRSGCLLGIGSISLANSTDFTFNDVDISLPETHLNNSDNTAQTLEGIIVTVGAISKTVTIGTTATVTALFKKVDNGSAWFEGASTFTTGAGSPVAYDYYVRTDQSIALEYTTVQGTEIVSLDLFQVRNIDGTNYEIIPITASEAVLPVYTKIQNYDLYQVATLNPETVAPLGLLTAFTDNSEWDVRVFQATLTGLEIYFNQRGKGGTDIPMIPKTLTGLSANTDYHIFIQYQYINNTISNLTVEYYTVITGNASLPTNYVQQRLMSFRTIATGSPPIFSHIANYVGIVNTPSNTIAKGVTTTLSLGMPDALPSGARLDFLFNDSTSRNGTVTQLGTQALAASGRDYYTQNRQLTVTNANTGAGNRDMEVYLVGYTDYTAATTLKGLYL
jgi:hypothetical protein